MSAAHPPVAHRPSCWSHTGLMLTALTFPSRWPACWLDPRDHHRRAGLAQAAEVRGLDRALRVHAGLGVHLPAGVARARRDRRTRHRRRLRDRAGDHRRPGDARHHQPFQRGDAASTGAVFAIMGADHRPADAARGGARRGAVAAAVRRSRARLGAAPRHGRHRARRVHRWPDDAADHGPDRRRAGARTGCRSRAPTPSARPTAARACR